MSPQVTVLLLASIVFLVGFVIGAGSLLCLFISYKWLKNP